MSRITKLCLWIIFILFAISLIGHFNKIPSQFVSPFVKPNLSNILENSLKDTKGRYGIYIKNLKSAEEFKLREHEGFQPGSLYKLWLMAAVFEKIKSGQLQENEVLSDNIEDLNKKFEIDPQDAELTEGSIELTVNSAIEQMITISHNYAALLLTEEVGVSKIADFLKRYNFNQSSVGDNLKTTPSDIALFFEKLYKGEVIDTDYSQKMLDILAKQHVNDRITKLLPEGTKVAHKTGDIDFFENDAGIVYSPNGDYILVVLSETDSPQAAGERIAQISKLVYDYFQRN